jgi:hypothetical protein
MPQPFPEGHEQVQKAEQGQAALPTAHRTSLVPEPARGIGRVDEVIRGQS